MGPAAGSANGQGQLMLAENQGNFARLLKLENQPPLSRQDRFHLNHTQQVGRQHRPSFKRLEVR